jgi:hypothetical protein
VKEQLIRALCAWMSQPDNPLPVMYGSYGTIFWKWDTRLSLTINETMDSMGYYRPNAGMDWALEVQSTEHLEALLGMIKRTSPTPPTEAKE